MKAKCQWCKRELDTKIAYKEAVNGKNKYWCNDDCYKAYEEEKEKQTKLKAEYDEIYELTKQIFGYEFAGYSLLKREIHAWEKVGSRQKIIAYLNENKEWLHDVMNREFASDFNRVRYYSTIVSSKLHDFKPKPIVEIAQHEKNIEICGVGPINYKPRGTHRGLDFLEDE